MTLTARVVCLRYTDPGAKVPTTIPAHCCARRHTAYGEGKQSHIPRYPDCAACATGKGIATALKEIGWEPPRYGRLNPHQSEQQAKRRRWLAENLIAETT